LQIKELQQDVLRMGALVETSVVMASQALCDRNLTVVEKIMTQDKEIDRYYRQIEMDCIRVIALRSPIAQDLRHIGTLMQLIRDLERIGDYSEDLGEIAMKSVAYPSPVPIERVRAMAQRCRLMLNHSLVALTNLDAELGLQIKQQDDAVDDDYASLYRMLATQSDIRGPLEPTLLTLLAIRHLERMADHATNIGRRVAYIVTGTRH
ncbi:MAG: phosphate signaling complex protein PhoU, partial [Cyanobacteria bacterium J06648_11]